MVLANPLNATPRNISVSACSISLPLNVDNTTQHGTPPQMPLPEMAPWVPALFYS